MNELFVSENIGGIALFCFALFLAIVWALFPFILFRKINELIKHIAVVEEHLRLIRYNDEKARRESLIAKEISDFRTGER